MIKFLVYLLVSVGLTDTLFSQSSEWERTGPLTFTGIQKISTSNLVATCDAGQIITSVDNGKSWNTIFVRSSRMFTALRFADSDNGIATADSGYFYMTNNGGKTWTEGHCSFPLTIIDVAYPVKDTIYMALSDGVCLRSFTNGDSWEVLHELQAGNNKCYVSKLSFVSGAYGYAGGNNSLLFRTTNAGQKWSDRTPIFLNSPITSIEATSDGKVAYATEEGTVNSTLDGVNWKGAPFRLGDTLNNPIDVIDIHNDTIYIFQRGGKYRITRTFSGNWRAVRAISGSYSFNQSMRYYAMYFDDSTGDGIAVGSSGTMYRLSDFARSGDLLHHCNIGDDATTPWIYLKGLDHNPKIVHAIAHTGQRFAHSFDGGLTWLTRTETNYGFGFYMGLHFRDDSSGIIFTEDRKRPVAEAFLSTTNNGLSWNYEKGSIRDRMYSVTNTSTGKLYITADSVVYRSLDDGFTWDTLWNFTNSYFDTSLHKVRFMLRSATFLNNDQDIFLETWAMDSVLTNPVNSSRITHSLLLASSDGGQNWEKRFSFPQIHTLKGMRFISSQLGYAETYFTPVKDSSKTMIWRTLDGGYNWDPFMELPRSWAPLSFGKSGKYGVLASIVNSDIYVTTDSGFTWKKDSIIYPLGAENVKFVLAHFTGDSLAILTSNVGFWRKPLENIPASVEWKKATSNPYLFIYTYPSPATGNATINCKVTGLFSIADPRSISLKVYDLLGREVKNLSSLVQSENDGSRSTFQFAGAYLDPGVYTLVLTTSNGGATKNMIVVR